ncbi:LacI family DNA-binding transcriptional regulator [Robbsia sp. KACC 23696]|uniref:LacI family DNA-binding transcriptional regulator n=1 Tax=Robbsia sp. KACC 23696 TaxID=3149231 RepID=UPI00325B6700
MAESEYKAVDATDASLPAPRRVRGTLKPPRITDVARSAGVSPITVSRVFNQPQTVAPETLERVREAVQKLGYVPNRLAGGLSSARSRLIAAIVPTIVHSLFSETIQAFSEAMSAAGYQVLLALSGYDDQNEEQLLDAVMSRRPEGVLLTGVAHTDSLRQRLSVLDLLIVETWDITDAPIDMLIGFSHHQVGEAVARRFLQRGVHRPALVSANDERAMARRGGFRETLAAEGISEIREVIVDPPSSVAIGKEAYRRLRDQDAAIDAIFCGSDLVALGVLREAKAAGVAIPESLAICGFGDLEFAAETEPRLSTVHVDGRRIGAMAARALLDRLQAESAADGATRLTATPLCADVGFALIDRDTI